MEVKDLLEKRLQELVTITKTISSEASEYKFQNNKLIKEIQDSGDTPEDLDENRKRVREMRRINILSFMKSNEVQINIRAMNEIYSIMKYMGYEPVLDAKDLEILEFNLANVKPTFIMDKGEVVFFNKEYEDAMMEELKNASPDELEQIQKVRNFNIDGKK